MRSGGGEVDRELLRQRERERDGEWDGDRSMAGKFVNERSAIRQR